MNISEYENRKDKQSCSKRNRIGQPLLAVDHRFRCALNRSSGKSVLGAGE